MVVVCLRRHDQVLTEQAMFCQRVALGFGLEAAERCKQQKALMEASPRAVATLGYGGSVTAAPADSVILTAGHLVIGNSA